MKEKKDGKLRLNKITIQNLETRLDRTEQKAIKGGLVNAQVGLTIIRVFC